jgi:transcriptional regulator
MANPRKKLLHGTLDALILKTLEKGPRHGYAIARWLGDATGDAIQVEEGSLYPALYRLEWKGLLGAEWGRSELDRRAKFYSLTDKGRTYLATEVQDWARFSTAVSTVLLGEA